MTGARLWPGDGSLVSRDLSMMALTGDDCPDLSSLISYQCWNHLRDLGSIKLGVAQAKLQSKPFAICPNVFLSIRERLIPSPVPYRHSLEIESLVRQRQKQCSFYREAELIIFSDVQVCQKMSTKTNTALRNVWMWPSTNNHLMLTPTRAAILSNIIRSRRLCIIQQLQCGNGD